MSSCSWYHFSVKTIFLIAITLAHTMSEIQAVMADPPYAVFHKNRVTFKRDQKFLSKVVLQFHMNQFICLPVFFPKPHDFPTEVKLHTLDVPRGYTFVPIQDKLATLLWLLVISLRGWLCHIRDPIWMMDCIKISCSLNKLLLPSQVRAHSANICYLFQGSPYFWDL